MAPTDDEQDQPGVGPLDRVLGTSENLVYAAAGAVLVLAAVLVLGTVAYHLVTDLRHGAEAAVTTALDGLLLVFIVLELLAGVRATMVERKLVAEPFLVVGIIASIKEIIVIALRAKNEVGLDDRTFQAAMTEMGVLGTLVLVLAGANYLVRRKEREPSEGAAA
jgi:uncharacterized membrane protein (DUF373 family)